ncbi:cupin domain-containing protein [Streptomyces flavofungini]|uniref:cupin domain-containing protein n=1 Tax=Streptomyces flavofungini TaxID=68200 RepID=UPI0025AF0FA0|nr:cupin domain-containing protein [Streptomyces flavofungini]WJV51578.1 cupin domain-containing protein [Streptomyces flavofungini]
MPPAPRDPAAFGGLPGGIGVSLLRVYDWPAADGLRGGTPHLHLTCTEGYAVVSGRGAVQTLTSTGFRQTPLTPGALVWFTPGTIHRLVNERDLTLHVLMQNSGLPEAGDAVLTLPPHLLTDPATYRAATALPPRTTHEGEAAATGDAAVERAARRRRDLAVEGFTALRAATEAGDPEPLAAFHRAAAALVAPLTAAWRERWRTGAAAAAAATGAQFDALAKGQASHLAQAAVRAELPVERGRFGMCGRLDVYETGAP